MLSVVEASPGRVPYEMGAEGTGRAPTVKGRRSALVCVMGPAEELSRCERVLARFTSGIEV